MGRIAYYNAIKCHEYLSTGRYADVVQPYLAEAADLDARKQRYARLFEVLNTRPYFDRTGACPCFLDVEILYPIPERDPGFRTSFEQLCLTRAEELLALDKPVQMLWSGGIDSTAALIAFLRVGARPEQLEVLLTDDSVEEYPLFFERFIRPTLRHRFTERRALSRQLSRDTVSCTGEPCDQLFGNLNKFLTRIGWDKAFSPWQDLFPTDLVELCEPIVAQAPVPLLTLNDYLWWMNFVLKYQQTSLRLLANLSGEPSLKDYWAGMHPFYATEAFQLWSLAGNEPKTGPSFESFKLPAKKIIYDFTQDTDYRNQKTKVGSLRASRDPDWLFLLTDGSLVYPSKQDRELGPTDAERAKRWPWDQ